MPTPKPTKRGPKQPARNAVDDTLALRGAVYGHFEDHAQISQDLKRVIAEGLKARDKTLLDNEQEALDMICHKIARIINGDSTVVDTWHDIAGYAELIAKFHAGESI